MEFIKNYQNSVALRLEEFFVNPFNLFAWIFVIWCILVWLRFIVTIFIQIYLNLRGEKGLKYLYSWKNFSWKSVFLGMILIWIVVFIGYLQTFKI